MLNISFTNNPWYHNKNSIWLVSTLRLFRNLEQYHFPMELAHTHQEQIMNLISQNLLTNPCLKNPTTLSAKDLEPQDKEFLFEYFLADETYSQAHAGEGFVVDEQGDFLATLNIKDHLHLSIVDSSGRLEESWNRLLQIENTLASVVAFAFSPKFGYLTSNPNNCGTAFAIHTYLHLPALIHTDKLEEVLDTRKEEGIATARMGGDTEETLGDILILHNAYTLGVSEEKLLSSMRAATIHFMMAEKSAREQILKDNNPIVKDGISKAFGLLKHSYQLETKEALNCLSLCKLGVELKWIKGILLEEINEMFFTCRRAHLLHHYQNNISMQNIVRKRAEYIHEKMALAELLSE